jgi:hypothetical protein
MFWNRVLWRIFRPKKDDVTGVWRKLHNEELHDLYSSLIISRIMKLKRIKLERNVERMERKRNSYILLVGEPDGKRLLRRPRYK